MIIQKGSHWHLRASFFLAFLLVISPLLPTIKAEGLNASEIAGTATEIAGTDPSAALSQILRLERVEVAGGAELITVQAKRIGTAKFEAWFSVKTAKLTPITRPDGPNSGAPDPPSAVRAS